EEEACRRGCSGAWLDTYSFQARAFYERLDYTVFGTIDNYPPGSWSHDGESSPSDHLKSLHISS
ncbi:hypothetical protein AB4Y44_42815, partial [Paraburkholderia sp. BR10937]